MGTLRKLVLLGTLSFITACSAVQQFIPEADQFAVSSAHSEIDAFQQPNGIDNINPTDAKSLLESVHKKLLPAAQKVCKFVEEQETCWWNVEYSPDPVFNAYATNKNLIVIQHGVLAKISSESELAFVMAHEMGHHIADHINEGTKRIMVGALIGALAMGKILHNQGSCYSVACQQAETDLIVDSADLGAQIGKRAYSKTQEREADLLAAYILWNSGFDLFESRYLLVKMGAMSSDKKTGFFDTHPAGPDRLATYDIFIQTVFMDDDFMPDKKSKSTDSAYVGRSEPNSNQSETNQSQDTLNSNPDTFSSSTQDKPWAFEKFSPATTPQKNKVTIISGSRGRAAVNTTLVQHYPVADSENSNSSIQCYRVGDKYVCDKPDR